MPLAMLKRAAQSQSGQIGLHPYWTSAEALRDVEPGSLGTLIDNRLTNLLEASSTSPAWRERRKHGTAHLLPTSEHCRPAPLAQSWGGPSSTSVRVTRSSRIRWFDSLQGRRLCASEAIDEGSRLHSLRTGGGLQDDLPARVAGFNRGAMCSAAADNSAASYLLRLDAD